MNPTRWILLAALAAAFMGGCRKEHETASKPAEPVATASTTPPPAATAETTPPPAETPPAPSEPVAAKPKAPKPPAPGKKTIADTDSYTLTLAAPHAVSSGREGSATVEVTPKQGWHLNKDFPTKLTVAAPAGVSVKKPEQTPKDAVAFSEERGTFSVVFQAASAGDKAFTGKLKFAVCTATSCDPKKEELAWNVKVE
jgi:hypothetical protein